MITRILWSHVTPMPELTIPSDDDIEALGRMIASENPRDNLAIQQAIAWTAKNEAARRGISVASLVMPNGIPGPQAGRYAATGNPATAATRSVAFDVLSGKVPDPTGGAIQFDAPETQDWLYAHGKVKSNAAMVAANRQKDGKEVSLTLAGRTSSMRFWRYA
jgi:hypothetical protein